MYQSHKLTVHGFMWHGNQVNLQHMGSSSVAFR